MDKNEVTQIAPNDVVELWCCGANVCTLPLLAFFHHFLSYLPIGVWNRRKEMITIIYHRNQQVPGAWLESKVKKVRNGRFCVGRVLSTGSLWVERDRLRLVKHIITVEGDNVSTDMTDPRSLLTTQASVGSIDNGRRSILDRFRRRTSSLGGCCTM